MDAHYDQVMRARAQATPGTRLYFGYSTVLDRAALEQWKQQHGYGFFTLPSGLAAQALDVAPVFDFPSRFWAGRVLGLADAPGSTVHGLLFEVGGQDWPVIQHKEGAVTGMCIEREVRVRVNGAEVAATAFVTAPTRRSTTGPVSAAFLEALLRGFGDAALPDEYVREVRRLAASS